MKPWLYWYFCVVSPSLPHADGWWNWIQSFHVVRNGIWDPYLDPMPSLASWEIVSNTKMLQCWIKMTVQKFPRMLQGRANIIVSVSCCLIPRSKENTIIGALWRLSKLTQRLINLSCRGELECHLSAKATDNLGSVAKLLRTGSSQVSARGGKHLGFAYVD